MWAGVMLAGLLSAAVGIGLELVERSLPQADQEGMEAIIGLIATVFVTGMIIWMNAHARDVKRRIEVDATQALGQASTYALASMAFLAVLREGFETSVFLLATFSAAESAALAAAGAVAGLLAAVAIGWGIYAGGVRINLSRFFRLTGAFLILVAAGLVVTSLRTAHEAGWLECRATDDGRSFLAGRAGHRPVGAGHGSARHTRRSAADRGDRLVILSRAGRPLRLLARIVAPAASLGRPPCSWRRPERLPSSRWPWRSSIPAPARRFPGRAARGAGRLHASRRHCTPRGRIRRIAGAPAFARGIAGEEPVACRGRAPASAPRGRRGIVVDDPHRERPGARAIQPFPGSGRATFRRQAPDRSQTAAASGAVQGRLVDPPLDEGLDRRRRAAGCGRARRHHRQHLGQRPADPAHAYRQDPRRQRGGRRLARRLHLPRPGRRGGERTLRGAVPNTASGRSSCRSRCWPLPSSCRGVRLPPVLQAAIPTTTPPPKPLRDCADLPAILTRKEQPMSPVSPTHPLSPAAGLAAFLLLLPGAHAAGTESGDGALAPARNGASQVRITLTGDDGGTCSSTTTPRRPARSPSP